MGVSTCVCFHELILNKALEAFIRGKIRRVLRRELYYLYEHVLSNKTRLSTEKYKRYINILLLLFIIIIIISRVLF